MSCNFCQTTPVNPCPVCSVAPNPSQVIRKVRGARIPPKQAPVRVAAPVAPSKPFATHRELVAEECAKEWAARQFNTATDFLIQLANPNKRALRTACLDLVDSNAAIRGYISEIDNATRRAIGLDCVGECVATLGFDPRFPRPADARPSTVHVSLACQDAINPSCPACLTNPANTPPAERAQSPEAKRFAEQVLADWAGLSKARA